MNEKDDLPTPAEVAAALHRMDDDFDEWLAVKTPLCERPFPILLGKTESLTREEFSDLSDCYMYSVRHGWTGWEQKHGKTPTHPTGDQVASIPPVGVIMTILDFRIAGFKREELPQPPAYWHRLTRLATTRLLGGLPLDLAGIYITAFRHGWWLRSQDAKNGGL